MFAGVGLPLVVVSFAMATHAPNMILFTEGGSIRATAPPGLAITVDDPALFCNGDATYGMLSTMAALQRGEVDVGFIGGAQIDKYGNINSTGVGDWTKPETFTYFAGSGGANDMATCSKRVLAIMPQDPKKFVETVDYLTTPGFLDGPGAAEAPRDDRRRSRLLSSVRWVFTGSTQRHAKCILPNITPGSPWTKSKPTAPLSLNVAPDVRETTPPTEEEITILRNIDPTGFYLG